MQPKPTKKVTYRRRPDFTNPVPALIIEGHFLKDLGFRCGDMVAIEYQRGKITIQNHAQQTIHGGLHEHKT